METFRIHFAKAIDSLIMLHTSDICCCLDTIMEMWVFFKKSIIKGVVHMSRAKSLLFNNITFNLA